MSDHLDNVVAGSDRPPASTGTPLVPLRPAPLDDPELREEIDLLLDVMATATASPRHLTVEQVDAALRLPAGQKVPDSTERGPSRRADEPVPEAAEASYGSAGARASGGAVSGVMGDLFDGEPENWQAGVSSCQRDVWSAMRSRLAADPVPPTRQAVERMLTDTFRAVVGVDLTDDPLPPASKHVYRLHMTENLTSSGVVDVEDWKHRLIPLLIDRADRTEPAP